MRLPWGEAAREVRLASASMTILVIGSHAGPSIALRRDPTGQTLMLAVQRDVISVFHPAGGSRTENSNQKRSSLSGADQQEARDSAQAWLSNHG
jgi:hypothetical protein